MSFLIMGVKKVAFNNVSTTTKMLPLLIDTLGIEKLDHQNVLKTGKILGYNTEIGVDEKSSNKNSIEFWVDGISNAETHLKNHMISFKKKNTSDGLESLSIGVGDDIEVNLVKATDRIINRMYSVHGF